MKRKFAIYLLVSTVLATGTAGGIKVFGQSAREPNRLPNNVPVSPNNGPNIGPYQTSAPIYQTHSYQTQSYPDGSPYPTTINGYIPSPGMPIQSTGPQPFPTRVPYQAFPGGPGAPNQGMMGNGPTNFTVVNKDGSVERIQKEAGIKLTKEEFDQVNETRQKVQSAVAQLRSQDADESKRKESKELIAKFLKVEFQADQESRREQVKRLENQVEQLKKQLSKRDESQDKLIELRLQLLENDASGLSFPESWGNLPGPLPMNSNLHSYSLKGGMHPSIANTTPFNPFASSSSPDGARPTVPGLPTTQPSVQSRN